MPQVVFLMIAGAGLYAGGRWAMRQLERMAAETARAAEEMRQHAEDAARSDTARDLGALVLDPATGQYRPKR
ncbi:MAG: hypothetical protein JNM89_03455 [Hyphomicrobiaceae bacterium]|nr:hypothetical protein [Hyphomicrobiaceae bacterium]